MRITFVHWGREHLGIEYLSAVIKKSGHEVFFAHDPGLFSHEDNVFYIPFLETFFNRKKEVLANIEKSNPDIVGFSVYSSTYPWALDIAGEVRKKTGAKIIFGGIHATLVPDAVIKNDVVDYVVEGEGEGAFLDLVESLSSKKEPRDIPNVWYKKNGVVAGTPVRQPVADLDSLPLPDKELFAEELNRGDDYMIMTSRGCKLSCSYCCESYMHALYGKQYFRRRSVSSVMHELTDMKQKYRFKRVMFFDNVFFTDKKWLQDLMKEYQKHIAVPFRCQGHVSFADADIIKLMKDAGCYGIDFGVQTFNEDIRKNLLNRFETNVQISKAFAACDTARLRYDVDLMLSLPMMKEDDYLLPLKVMEPHRYLNRIKCFNLCYYPKLNMTQKAKELGVLTDSDVQGLARGATGDFFHADSIKQPADKIMKDNFQKLYKIYPLIPGVIRRQIIGKKRYRWVRFFPKPLIVFAQFIIGVMNNDLRFYTYISYYFSHARKRFGHRQHS